ncbi:MAG: hypothetical protein ACLR4Z_16330 [Butyricicoccaceae bacterium]
MMKKLLCTVFAVFAVMTAAGAVGNIFPASRTDIDGVTRSGYLDEEGAYRAALRLRQRRRIRALRPCGGRGRKMADRSHRPRGKADRRLHRVSVSVDFSDSMIAYRYADHSVYYTLSGTKLGSYPGAEGF